MSFQESKYVASFLTFLGVGLYYLQRAHGLWDAGAFDGPEGMAALGRSLLWFIAAMVGFGILGQIIVAILRGIIGADVDGREDERDRQIEYRAMNAAFTLLSLFFVSALLGLAFGGWTAVAALLTITAGFVAAGLLADIWRFTLYRWGFR